MLSLLGFMYDEVVKMVKKGFKILGLAQIVYLV